jgi:tetratricopeptide (TPR) repeat protein
VLSLMGWVVYSVLVPVAAPRTQSERETMRLEELSKTQPTNAIVWADWAKALVLAGEYSKAADVIRRGSEEASPSAPIFVVEAQLLSEQKRYGQALEVVVGAIADLRRLEEAEIAKMAASGTSATESAQYSPYIVDGLILEGDLLARTGKPSESIRAYSAALDRRGNMADVLAVRGSLYAATGRRAEAVADFRKALTMIPGYPPAIEGLKKLGEAATK